MLGIEHDVAGAEVEPLRFKVQVGYDAEQRGDQLPNRFTATRGVRQPVDVEHRILGVQRADGVGIQGDPGKVVLARELFDSQAHRGNLHAHPRAPTRSRRRLHRPPDPVRARRTSRCH